MAIRPNRKIALATSTATQVPRHAPKDESLRRSHCAPAVLATAAVGLLLVSIGYALARRDITGVATACYWVGQLSIFVPVAIVAVMRNRARVDYYASLFALALGTGLAKWAYSPLQLKFVDENQHLLGTYLLLQTGRFGAPNASLNIGPKFPGMELVGASISRVTGASPEATGLALGVIFHVAVTVAVFSLFVLATGSPRGGLVATALYACNADFGFFGSMYVYENLALAFAMAALVMLYRSTAVELDPRRAMAGYVLTAALFLATVVTHHLTAIFLSFSTIVTAALAFRRRLSRRRGVVAFAMSAGAFAVTAGWFALVAPETWVYLRPYVVHFGAVNETGRTTVNLPGPSHMLDTTPPRPDYFTAAAGLILTVVLLLLGAVIAWRRRSRFLAVICVLSVLMLGAVQYSRFASQRGSEISGRSDAFVYVAVAIAAAVSIIACLGRQLWVRLVAAATVCVVYAGGLMLAWPASWDRLPLPAVLATQFERGYSPEGRAAARWASYGLPRQSRVAADYMGIVDLDTRAGVVGVFGDAPVFYAKRIGRLERRILIDDNVGYVWINKSMAWIQTPNGRYYGNRGYAYSIPPSMSSLLKFQRNPNDSKVYDNGLITIYNIQPERLP